MTTPSPAKVLRDYFGYLPGQKLADFAAEIKQLDDNDKAQLVSGITDGSLTY